MNDAKIKELIAQGYCRTSRKFGLISRIDREDWKEFSATKRYPIDADWYRRCVSKDTIEIGQRDGLKFPASHESKIEFSPK